MEYELLEGVSLTDYQIRTLEILNNAEKLLLQFGYSKVTVNDIAAAAKLGKGTIYLHWKSKENLFYALLSKVSAEVIYEVLQVIKNNKDMVLLDNLLATLYSVCMQKDIIVALFTKESKLLGSLLNKETSALSQITKSESLRKSIEIYRVHKLVRRDMPVEIQLHSINLLMTGMFNYNSYLKEPLTKDNQILIIKTIIRNTLLTEKQSVVNEAIYHYICNEFDRLLEFYKRQVLYSTIK